MGKGLTFKVYKTSGHIIQKMYSLFLSFLSFSNFNEGRPSAKVDWETELSLAILG